MRLKLALNIGDKDAKRLELDKTQAGDIVEVKKEAADEMLLRGWGVDPTGTREVIDVTPGAPELDFDTMTKEDLKTFADENKVEGVTQTMNKDDMLRAVKKFNRNPHSGR